MLYALITLSFNNSRSAGLKKINMKKVILTASAVALMLGSVTTLNAQTEPKKKEESKEHKGEHKDAKAEHKEEHKGEHKDAKAEHKGEHKEEHKGTEKPKK